MYEIHKRVRNLRTSGGKSWEDLCVKVPVVNLNDLFSLGGNRRRKRSEFDDFDFDEDFDFESIVEQEEEAMGEGEGRKSGLDPSVHLYPDAYCAVAESLPLECYQVRYGGENTTRQKETASATLAAAAATPATTTATATAKTKTAAAATTLQQQQTLVEAKAVVKK